MFNTFCLSIFAHYNFFSHIAIADCSIEVTKSSLTRENVKEPLIPTTPAIRHHSPKQRRLSQARKKFVGTVIKFCRYSDNFPSNYRQILPIHCFITGTPKRQSPTLPHISP